MSVIAAGTAVHSRSSRVVISGLRRGKHIASRLRAHRCAAPLRPAAAPRDDSPGPCYSSRQMKGAVMLRLISTALLMCMAAIPAFGDELKVGDKAPDFTMVGSDGKTHSLAELKGKTVVLAWFPKAFTGG
jgi:hypothetical protein